MAAMQKLRLFVVASAFALASARDRTAFAEAPRVVDRIAAIVDHDPIVMSEVLVQAAPDLARAKASGDAALAAASPQILRLTLERLIDDLLITAAAERKHIIVSDRDVDNAFDAVQSSTGFKSKAAFLVAVAAQGLDELTYRRMLRQQILEAKFFREEFEAARARISPSMISARLTKLRAQTPRATEDDAKSAVETDVLADVRKAGVAELREGHFIEVRL
ncbi:hypothetical protein BH09MYX1_BH09MYX1_40780 [soil metagenome]